MNENDKREAVRRILHDFVMLRLRNNVKLGEIADLLDQNVNRVYGLFEDDLNQYAGMLDSMSRSAYAPGVAGLANMVTDVKNFSEQYARIRKALGEPDLSYISKAAVERVEALAKESRDRHRERFDFREFERMREALEEAGFSPDSDGVQALLADRDGLQRGIQEVEKVVELADPKLRRTLSLPNAVARIAANFKRARKLVQSIHDQAAEGLDG